jgi:hypothetical protein
MMSRRLTAAACPPTCHAAGGSANGGHNPTWPFRTASRSLGLQGAFYPLPVPIYRLSIGRVQPIQGSIYQDTMFTGF